MLVTSVNVACGFHAGDERRCGRLHRGGRCGRRHRRARVVSRPRGLRAARAAVEAETIARRPPSRSRRCRLRRSGRRRVAYVKPHGALYHRASVDAECAGALVAAAAASLRDHSPCSASPARRCSRSHARPGSPAVAEGFADRAYAAEARSAALRVRVAARGGRAAARQAVATRPWEWWRRALDLRARRHRVRRRCCGAGARGARFTPASNCGVRMSGPRAASATGGALVELPDSPAAVRVARALAGRAELVEVVPGPPHRPRDVGERGGR